MNSLYLAASVVIPLLIYMLVGGLVRKLSILNLENFKEINGLVFKVLLPLTLFFDVYRADLGEAVNPMVFAFAFISIMVVYFATWVIITKTIPDNADASTMIQGIYRSNFVLFGSTISASLCGATGTAMIAALSAMVVPQINILAVILFELKRGGDVNTKQLIINIFKNPLVDAGILGFVCNVIHLPIPELLANPLIKLGSTASPIALMALGGMLSFGSMVKHRKKLVAVNIGRLIIVPVAVLGVAILLGFRGEILVAFLSIFAAPTAVASGPMAQVMGGNGELAGEIVATTSVFCILTLFIMVFGLSSIGLI